MSKKSTKKVNKMNRTVQHVDIDAPEVVDMDTLSYLNDGELETRYRFINEDKSRAQSYGISPFLWEIELAYMQREFGIRSTRRVAHEKYVKQNPDSQLEMMDQPEEDYLEDSSSN